MSGADDIEKIDPVFLSLPDDEIMGMAAPAAPAAAQEAAAGTEAGAGEGASAGSGEAEAGAAGEGGTPAANAQAAAAESTDDAANTGKTEAGGQNDGGEAAGGTGEAGAGEDGASGEAGGEGKAAGEQNTDPNKAAAADAGKDAGKTPGTTADGQAAAPRAAPEATAGGAVIKPLGDYTAEDKAKAFDQVMAPFKANDRMIELRSPEEAVKLMQMGANYTKKLQTLQPHLRATKMLENNGLLDENKLSFLIDLSKGNPLAIQKLLADTQFDPMGVDKDKAADYTPGNHQVSDNEMAFQAALDDLEATDDGKTFIQELAQWDTASKQALFQHPEVLQELNQQRGLGLYEQITSEMQRLKVLGQIPQSTPFLQAYRAVGDMLHAQGTLKPKTAEAPAVVTEQPVETRTIAPPAKAANSEQAAKAALTKSNPAAEATTVNDVLNMPDDKFMAEMRGRL